MINITYTFIISAFFGSLSMVGRWRYLFLFFLISCTSGDLDDPEDVVCYYEPCTFAFRYVFNEEEPGDSFVWYGDDYGFYDNVDPEIGNPLSLEAVVFGGELVLTIDSMLSFKAINQFKYHSGYGPEEILIRDNKAHIVIDCLDDSVEDFEANILCSIRMPDPYIVDLTHNNYERHWSHMMELICD